MVNAKGIPLVPSPYIEKQKKYGSFLLKTNPLWPRHEEDRIS